PKSNFQLICFVIGGDGRGCAGNADRWCCLRHGFFCILRYLFHWQSSGLSSVPSPEGEGAIYFRAPTKPIFAFASDSVTCAIPCACAAPRSRIAFSLPSSIALTRS